MNRVPTSVPIVTSMRSIEADLLTTNLDSGEDWDVEVDEFADAAPPMFSQTDQSAVSRYRTSRGHSATILDGSNALDDLHPAL